MTNNPWMEYVVKLVPYLPQEKIRRFHMGTTILFERSNGSVDVNSNGNEANLLKTGCGFDAF